MEQHEAWGIASASESSWRYFTETAELITLADLARNKGFDSSTPVFYPYVGRIAMGMSCGRFIGNLPHPHMSRGATELFLNLSYRSMIVHLVGIVLILVLCWLIVLMVALYYTLSRRVLAYVRTRGGWRRMWDRQPNPWRDDLRAFWECLIDAFRLATCRRPRYIEPPVTNSSAGKHLR